MERTGALTAVLLLSLGCRSRHALRPDAAVHAIDAGEAPILGPPNPWGDRSLPVSTATGPEADATRASLNALRASIGFWRMARDAQADCPTLVDLARSPLSGFNPDTMTRDAWGTPFEIECQGARVRLRSLGPDRTRDTPDDLWAQ